MSVIAELIAKISIQVEGSGEAKKELGEAETATGDLEEKGGSKLSKFAEVAKVAFGKVAQVTAAATAALLTAGAAVFAFANKATSEIADIGHKAKQTGLGEEAYQRLSHLADVTGTSIDAVGKAAKKTEIQLLDAAQGGGKGFTDALDAIGLAAQDLEGLDATERFGLIGDAMKKLGTDGERAAIASKLFGEEAGPGLLGLLEQGTAGIEKLSAAAGDVFTEDEIERAQSFQDSITGIKRTLSQAAGTLAVALTPALESVVAVFQEWIADNDEFIKQELPKLLTTVLGAASKLAPVFLGVAKTVAKLVEDAAPLIDRFSIFLSDKLAKGLGSTETLLSKLLPIVLALAEAILDVVEGIEKAYRWATTLGSIETNQATTRGTPGFLGDERGAQWSEEQLLARDPQEIARREAEARAADEADTANILRDVGASIISDARSKNRKLNATQIENLQAYGYTADEIDAYQSSVKRPKGSGRSKPAAEAKQEFHLTSFEQLLQTTLGEGFDLKNLDLRRVDLEPKEIKPEAVVTVNNYNFTIDQDIQGNTDPKAIADMSARAIREFFDSEIARAGQSLAPNLAR
jgi:hypothetical protein